MEAQPCKNAQLNENMPYIKCILVILKVISCIISNSISFNLILILKIIYWTAPECSISFLSFQAEFVSKVGDSGGGMYTVSILELNGTLGPVVQS